MSINNQIVKHTALIVKAYLSHNPVPPKSLPLLLSEVAKGLKALPRQRGNPKAFRPTRKEIFDSIREYSLISFEDGRGYRLLKGHLTRLGLTPEAYREKWGLPKNYPMMPPLYKR